MRSRTPDGAVLVDRHPVSLAGLELILERLGIAVAAATADPDEGLLLVGERKPSLVAVASNAWNGDGPGYVRRLRAAAPGAAILVLADAEGLDDATAALRAGAQAYVVKTAPPEDISSALKQVFGPSFVVAHAAVTGAPAAGTRARPITSREAEILVRVAEGRSNAEVARLLWITEQTVKFHLSNIYRKLGVSNRTEASRWAQRAGLLDQADR